MSDTPPLHILHIYGQQHWHDGAQIVGTRDALETLVRLLQQALAAPPGEVQTSPVEQGSLYANDGEGYQVAVCCTEHPEWWCVPYTDESAREDTACWPRRKPQPKP